ncbi:MAG: Bro-N domain-containing protein [Slackia piriformis]|uniref:Bro-N domain-containing protein n=1 Tax=Slackia piriformis TaxID=626934 RepID=A0A943V042_9ACTN|nr:Bro-N domain-containing protein [Slackia piriformis]
MDMQIFENAQFGVIRAAEIDGEPWFVAKDVCDALEIGNASQALSRLDDDEKNTLILNDGIPGNPNKAVVNEPGLYSLIMSSRKHEAKAFKRWVTHEVLPAIHRDGAYVASDGTEDDMAGIAA